MSNSIEQRLLLIDRKIRLRNVHLEPPLAKSKVERFERAANVTLPEGYRRLITEIGNGGEGPPTYGMFPFPDVMWDAGELSKPFPFNETWNWEDREIDDDVCSRTLHGNIRLGEDGCMMHWILILVGDERGQVWDWFEYNVQPCRDRRDFLTWYDDRLNGRDDCSIPPISPISDEEFFRIYTAKHSVSETQNPDPQKKWWQFWRRA